MIVVGKHPTVEAQLIQREQPMAIFENILLHVIIMIPNPLSLVLSLCCVCRAV